MTTNNDRRQFLSAGGLSLALLTTGCVRHGTLPNLPTAVSPDLQMLSVILSASSAAVAVLTQDVTLSQALGPASDYLSAVAVAVGAIGDALKAGSVLTKADGVIVALQKLVQVPAIAAAAGPKVSLILSAVAAGVAAYLATVPPAPASVSFGVPAACDPQAGGGCRATGPKRKLSSRDSFAVETIRGDALSLKTRLAKVRKP